MFAIVVGVLFVLYQKVSRTSKIWKSIKIDSYFLSNYDKMQHTRLNKYPEARKKLNKTFDTFYVTEIRTNRF